MSSMFALAHLSDLHLGPLPVPRLREFLGKRATRFINWWRKRHRIHRGDVLARIVADAKAQAPNHIADRVPPARTPAHDLLPLFASHDSGGPDRARFLMR
jgi:hypothetical protein